MPTYFIQAGPSGPIKIGHFTGDVRKRCYALQTANHEHLVVLGVSDKPEKFWHRRFRPLRIRGEWFRPEPKLILVIVEQFGMNVLFHGPRERRSAANPKQVAWMLHLQAERELDAAGI